MFSVVFPSLVSKQMINNIMVAGGVVWIGELGWGVTTLHGSYLTFNCDIHECETASHHLLVADIATYFITGYCSISA